ncbi:MAG TPA: NUDIX hydrolase [Planctomycetota bacterium]|nr:NUDIX hydrolase [Planctomycetota bacterium]
MSGGTEEPRADVLGTEEVFRGKIFRVVRERFRTPFGRAVVQELILHPGAAVVLPKMDADRVLLVRQYRHAARAFLWEAPAGRLEPGESPEQAARRELREETGLRAERWTRLGGFFPAPGITSEFMHLFLAEGLAPDGGAAPDEDEEIETGVFPLAEIRRRIRDGEIRDGKTIVALALLGDPAS